MLLRSNTNQSNSLYHLALRWALAKEADYPFNPDFLQDANLALDQVSRIIMRFDNTWEWSDHNHASQDIATTPLVSGKSTYPVILSHLKIIRVRVSAKDGSMITLNPIQRREQSDHLLAATGQPTGYDKLGGVIELRPTPDYAGTIEMQYQQTSNYFEAADTDKEPGFDPTFHELVALYPALTYCEINGIDGQAAKIRNRIGQAPTKDIPGTGILNELALRYQQRDYDAVQSLNIKRNNRGINTLI